MRPFNNKVNGEGEIGVVDSNTTFKGWFDKQDASFQKVLAWSITIQTIQRG